MAISVQYATATADGAGDAVFMFPDVPQGQRWSGPTTIPAAPQSFVGQVYAGGALLGPMLGPGIYGSWTVEATGRLSIVATGLEIDTQYQAVWHVDDSGITRPVLPTPVAPGVATTVILPTPLPITGTVTADQGSPPWQVDVTNFPADQVVSGAVTVTPNLAAHPVSGQTTMTGSDVQLPAHAATQGVYLSTPVANAHPIEVGPSGVTTGTGLVLDPGCHPVFYLISDSSDLYAIGTASDVLSWLVT